MFRIVSGKIGAGKTYYAVNYVRKFCDYDPVYNVMILRPEVLLISNIDDLKVSHMRIEKFLSLGLMNNVQAFRKYMEEHQYKRAIFVIDEAQKLFDDVHKDKDRMFFIEYHRHLGLDIFMIVPGVQGLPKRLVELAEYIIMAVPRSYAIGLFKYFAKDTRTFENIFSTTLKKDQRVFMLYKSFETDEVEKPKPVVLIRLVASVVAFVSIIGGMYWYMVGGGLHWGGKEKVAKAKTETVERTEKPVSNVDALPEKPKKLEETYQPRINYAIIEGQANVVPGGPVKGYVYGNGKTYILYE